MDLQGASITLDAMGTPKGIAAQIIDGAGDDAGTLKGNQESRHQGAIADLAEQLEGDLKGAQAAVTPQKGYGREARRTAVQLPAPADRPGSGLWKALSTLAIVTALGVRAGTQTAGVRSYLSSLAMDVKGLARAVRGDGGLENGCHGVCDVRDRADKSGIRAEGLRENFAWLNRFTLSLWKQPPDCTVPASRCSAAVAVGARTI